MEEEDAGVFQHFFNERRDLHDLVLVSIWGLLTLGIIIFGPDMHVLRLLISIPFLMFLPGYALISAFWPRKNELDERGEGADVIERIGLSVGLSVAIVAVIGIGLSITGMGVRLSTILWSIWGFIMIFISIAFIARKGIPEEDRYQLDIISFLKQIK